MFKQFWIENCMVFVKNAFTTLLYLFPICLSLLIKNISTSTWLLTVRGLRQGESRQKAAWAPFHIATLR